MFFYTEVDGNKDHYISTESEFSPNSLKFYAEPGQHYFFRQFIKWGVFVGGADVEQMPEVTGKADIARLQMAVPGTCSSTPPQAETLK